MNTSAEKSFTQSSELVSVLLKECQNVVSPKRYAHILKVTETCREIAFRVGADSIKATIAGSSHDLAREWEDKKILAFLEERQFRISPDEYRKPILLHGAVASYLIQENYQIHDREILEAVQHHTLGSPGIGQTGKILFLADYLEPGRKYMTKSFFHRILELDTLDHMLVEVFEQKKSRHRRIHPRTYAMIDEAKKGIQQYETEKN